MSVWKKNMEGVLLIKNFIQRILQEYLKLYATDT